MQIAKTIQQQLLTLGKIKVWSWGAHNWTAVNVDKNEGLQFRVQGFKFKGTVQIILKGDDTYTILFIKGLRVPVIEKTYEGIYFDQMVDLIDNYVEYTGNDYEDRVNKAVYKL